MVYDYIMYVLQNNEKQHFLQGKHGQCVRCHLIWGDPNVTSGHTVVTSVFVFEETLVYKS